MNHSQTCELDARCNDLWKCRIVAVFKFAGKVGCDACRKSNKSAAGVRNRILDCSSVGQYGIPRGCGPPISDNRPTVRAAS